MKILLILASLFVSITFKIKAENNDSTIIANMYKNALTSYESYNNLKVLCDSASPRMMGSENSIKAVNLLEQMLKKNDFDKVYKQEFETSAWICNSKGKAIVTLNNGEEINLKVDALGPSVATIENGITANVIEVKDIKELESLNKETVKGKIVFFNKAMENTFSNPIDAYVDAIGTRLFGTSRAAEFGAVGVLMRSLTTSLDDLPHPGSTIYNEEFKKLPVLAVSSNDSELLSRLLKTNPDLKTNIFVDSKIEESIKSYNVIAEITGKTNPEEIIAIGAHTDTWYSTPGANDDGAGCVQMMDVLRIFKELNIENNKTIRVILFMDEELNKSGAKAYANSFDNEKETIVAAIESDLGGFSPNGFFIDGNEPIVNQIQAYKKLLFPYGIYNIKKGFGGGDMGVLKKKFGFPSIALGLESERYFELIHTTEDSFDKVNRRELQKGTAAIASLVFLLDKYGSK